MTDSDSKYLTRNVFVAGASPSVTYNPRDERKLESEVRRYLGQRGKALSVSGPTKCGKTVLIERLLPRDEAIWMQGADLDEVGQLWHRIVDWFGLYDTVQVTQESTESDEAAVSGEVNIPGVARVGGQVSTGSSGSDSYGWERQRPIVQVAREALEIVSVPIVVDDFHYVPEEVRRATARSLKSVLPLANVILIAVPHEAFEAVQQEPDMGGRVWTLTVDPWSVSELQEIARKGFGALNVTDPGGGLSVRLAESSFGAPFLMQQLCYDLMWNHGIMETQDELVELGAPQNWRNFFGEIANRQRPAVFKELLKGPNPRGQERAERRFKDGRTTDIYGAVMHAIAEAGPSPRIRYQELVRILERDLESDTTPRGHQVTHSLSHMAKIADEHRGEGDAALDYKDDELHILDPFLMFFLRYGTWDVERHALSSP